MSTSQTAIRFATIFFLLAGLLLLKKPVFGETGTSHAPRPVGQTITAPALKPVPSGVEYRIRTNFSHIEST